jgi:proteasome alpha subunit
LYDGTVIDERRYSVLGGDVEAIAAAMAESMRDDFQLGGAIKAAIAALAGADRKIAISELEVALLTRSNGRRCFRRLNDDQVEALVGPSA